MRTIVRCRVAVLGAVVLTLGAVAGGGGAANASVTTAPGPVVATDSGKVRGVTDSGVDSFLGIRYAMAPTGELRWKPPQPATPWRGIADATRYGNRCSALPSTNGPLSLSEDCLFLNVQRPAGIASSEHLPVYVFIHGGGNTNGSSNQHDGSTIAVRDRVIVVTMNYRLGVLGWFAHPALTTEQGESGNYGFQDIEASLAWVHDNIAAFGGDPAAVTVGGESAGAFSVCALLSAPAVAGMFSAAMMQSGGCSSQSLAESESFGTDVAARAGCGDPASALSCLRSLGTQALLDAGNNDHGDYVRGTATLPDDPWGAVQDGRFARVPIVVGANRDEGRTFTVDQIGMTKSGYEGWLVDNFGDFATEVAKRYPWPSRSDRFTGAYLTGAIITDGGLFGLGGCWNRQLADTLAASTRVWVYEFAHRTGPGLRPDPVGYHWGAGHAAELPYLWPSFDNGTPIAATFERGERQLSRDMVAYWGDFIRSHGVATTRTPRWSGYNAAHQVLSLRPDGQSTMVSDQQVAREHLCRFWG